MSNENDPFADQPYEPPHRRDDEAADDSGQPSADASPGGADDAGSTPASTPPPPPPPGAGDDEPTTELTGQSADSEPTAPIPPAPEWLQEPSSESGDEAVQADPAEHTTPLPPAPPQATGSSEPDPQAWGHQEWAAPQDPAPEAHTHRYSDDQQAGDTQQLGGLAAGGAGAAAYEAAAQYDDPYRQQDPYAQNQAAADPYAQQQAPADPYAQQDYAQDPYAQPAPTHDPYAQPAGNDPYASNDPFLVAPAPAAPGKQKRPKEKKGRGGRLVAGGLALVLLAGAAGLGGAALYDALSGDSSGDGGIISSLGGDEDDGGSAPEGQVEKVAEAVLPSVTQINVSGGGAAGSGTGIVLSSDGEMLTNNHVIEAAADGGTITVAFSDGTNAEAEIVGRDPKTDLAVIKVEGKTDLKPASLGSSADLTVGQEVVAIGSPFGLESTVTSGIVSALNRPVAAGDGSGGSQSTVFPAVQTDAAINPGNSGGPLVDLQGRVVGVNSAIRSGGSSAGDAGSIGLGFAIPIDLASSVAEQLREGKTVEHAQIGVTVRPAVDNDEITGIGAEVVEVSNGSAGADAGLREGDVITAIDDVPVGSSNALVAAIRGYRPGQEVTLTFLRGGERQEATITLDSDGGQTG